MTIIDTIDRKLYPGFQCNWDDQIFRESLLSVIGADSRVLRPLGKLLFKTPNRWQFMSIIARVTPHGFHQWFNRRRGRGGTDRFPTCYLCNSPTQVRTIAEATKLSVDGFALFGRRPEYLRISTLTYLFGAAYERVMYSSSFFKPFRILQIATLSKQGSSL